MKAPNKDVTQMLQAAEKNGHRPVRAGNGHFNFYGPDGQLVRDETTGLPLSCPSSPSQSSIRNTRERLRKAGVLRGPGRPRKPLRESVTTAFRQPSARELRGDNWGAFVQEADAYVGTPVHVTVVAGQLRIIGAARDRSYACGRCAVDNGHEPVNTGYLCPFHREEEPWSC